MTGSHGYRLRYDLRPRPLRVSFETYVSRVDLLARKAVGPDGQARLGPAAPSRMRRRHGHRALELMCRRAHGRALSASPSETGGIRDWIAEAPRPHRHARLLPEDLCLMDTARRTSTRREALGVKVRLRLAPLYRPLDPCPRRGGVSTIPPRVDVTRTRARSLSLGPTRSTDGDARDELRAKPSSRARIPVSLEQPRAMAMATLRASPRSDP